LQLLSAPVGANRVAEFMLTWPGHCHCCAVALLDFVDFGT